MRIIAVSDTHMPRMARELPAILLDAVREADLVVHAGDMTAPDVPALVERWTRFDGVAGNNDGPALRERFGRSKVIEAGGLRLGLTHGDEGRGRSTPERAWATFVPAVGRPARVGEGGAIDAVVFGHSHIPLLERRFGIWLVNPGSPTDKRRQRHYSFAVLDVVDGRLVPSLRFFDRSAW